MARQFSKYVTADTSVVTTAETAAVTADGVTTPSAGAVIAIQGDINITTGAATTAVTIRLRRGSGITGTIVGETKLFTVGAAVSTDIPFGFTDAPGDVANQQYTATIQATAATGNGTINNASITVSVDAP